MDRFLSDEQIRSLHGYIDQGFATAQRFQRGDNDELSGAVVQFRRPAAGGEFEDVGDPVTLVTIAFGLREGRTLNTTPLQEDMSDGDIRLYAEDFVPKPGDRFQYKGFTCRVMRVFPPEHGVIQAEVEIIQRVT